MDATGRKVGRYELRQPLGSGGFATVYRAYDASLDREVAVKVLHPHLAADPALRDRFVQEGRALARVRHPNVVVVHEAGEADGAVFLATELIDGHTLDDELATGGQLTLSRTTSVVEQIAGAVAACHVRGLVHRDIKPANIMIEDGTGRAVLLDLGIARDMQSGTATASVVVGTPSFMAPEQAEEGGRVTPATDIYQLGATTYALLAGRPPYGGDVLQALTALTTRPPAPLLEARPDLPPAVAGTIAAAMARQPSRRPVTPGEFAARLRAAAGSIPTDNGVQVTEPYAASMSGLVTPAHLTPPPATPAPGTPTPFPSRRRTSRLPLLVGAGVLAVAAVAAGGWWATQRDGSSSTDDVSGAATPATGTIAAGIPAISGGTAAAGSGTAAAGGGTVAAGARSADGLRTALLSTPFRDDELPQGVKGPVVVKANEPPSTATLLGAIGRVDVDFNAPDAGSGIAYIIYPTADAAEARVTAINLIPPPDAKTFTAAGLPDLTTCLNRKAMDSGPNDGSSICVIVIDNVEINAGSVVKNGGSKGDEAVALAVSRAAIAHLNRVRQGR